MQTRWDEWQIYILLIFSSATSNTDDYEYMVMSEMSVLEEKLINKLFWYCVLITFVLDRMSSTSNPLLHSSLLNNNCVSYH